jgi:hypothetical protein
MIGLMATFVALSLGLFQGIGWPAESAPGSLAAVHNMPQNAIPPEIS